MGRLQPDLLERVETFADRILDVVEALAPTTCPRRVLEQIAASGTSIGANTFEADEAMSRADFAKTLAIALKELNETRFWLRLVARRTWLPPTRLSPLQADADELRKILGAIITRTRNPPNNPQKPRPQPP
jgi:four helix bundle protein